MSVNNKRRITTGSSVEPRFCHLVIQGQSFSYSKINLRDSKVGDVVHFPNWTGHHGRFLRKAMGKEKKKEANLKSYREDDWDLENSLSYFLGILKLQLILDGWKSNWFEKSPVLTVRSAPDPDTSYCERVELLLALALVPSSPTPTALA